jgi:hypothetical protein
MFRRMVTGVAPATRRLIAAAGLAVAMALAAPAHADDHHGGFHDRDDRDHDHDRFHGGGFGLFLGAPAYVAPPPVYYAPAYPSPYGAYPYAPVPVTGVFATPQGYCQNYRTAAGIETACQGPDGVWRFIN